MTNTASSVDEQYMQRCMQLAILGKAHAAPNPMVGAVLVHDSKIIGEGWHQKYGEPHAEVNCINSVASELTSCIAKSTLYVSLEPCAHYGKTPPCAELILKYKIPKVVIGCVDTFSEVSGKGIEMLKNAGVEVITGVLEQECRALNKYFFTCHEKKRPYITLKWATTHDGYIAGVNNQQVQISNEYAQILLHKWRTEFSGFLVGYNTVVADNPRLSNRLWPVDKQPIRLILDKENQLPCDRNIFDGSQLTYIFNTSFQQFSEMTNWIKIDASDFLKHVIDFIYSLGLTNMMVEGGAKTLNAFIDKGYFDEIITIQSPKLLFDGLKQPEVPIFKSTFEYKLLDDTVTHYYY